MSALTRRSVVSSLASVALTGLAAPHIARAAVRQIRFGHNGPDESTYGYGSRAFAAAVEQDPVLAGIISVQVRGNAQLGDEVGMLRDCGKGVLDMMICATSTAGNVVPEIGMINALFLFDGAKHARSVLDGPTGEVLAQFARPKGLRVIAWGEAGTRHFTANKPIREPGDVRGLKIRASQSEVMIGGLQALGADVTPLSYDLLREALRTGQVEAQENSIAAIESKKLYETQKYLSLTGHSYDGALFLASSDLIEDLTPPQLAAMTACGRKAALVTREFLDTTDRDGKARLVAAGMEIIETPDIPAFKAASEPYLQSLGTRFGADLVNRIRHSGA